MIMRRCMRRLYYYYKAPKPSFTSPLHCFTLKKLLPFQPTASLWRCFPANKVMQMPINPVNPNQKTKFHASKSSQTIDSSSISIYEKAPSSRVHLPDGTICLRGEISRKNSKHRRAPYTSIGQRQGTLHGQLQQMPRRLRCENNNRGALAAGFAAHDQG